MKIPRVHASHGRWYFLEDLAERNPKTGRPRQKRHPLSRVDQGEVALLEALATLKARLGELPAEPKGMAADLQAFRDTHLRTLTHDVRKEYERMLDVVAEAFAEFDTPQVTPADVLAFLNDNFADKPTARRAYKARLSTFFAWCVLKGTIAVNPCREIKLQAPPKRRGRMTDTLFWAIHDALPPMGRCFLELVYLTRQRPTEIRLLRESKIGDTHIDFKPTKTTRSSGAEVEILITPEIRAALDRARALRPKSKVEELARHRDPYLIQTRDGDHYTKTGLYEVWRDAIAIVAKDHPKARGVTTRDVRPYALAKMEQAGYSLREIQLAAAHTDVSTTEGYLNQHRSAVSDAVIYLPGRKT